ncbi:MAG: DNA polymerase III subunit gamma/tau [Burkholderia sp.]|nr:MAG: Holliday junction ATP-dependent DNA helicase RuvB [Burkholderia gladioli]
MTYQVLARKWRPKDFAALVGQEHVVRALTHALDGGRLHHAYLITGTRGVGKTTLSRIFAKALNCETRITSQPCGVCRACREIDEGRFVDYVEMDAASNRGVDEMVALLERAVYAPVNARFKVYMIDEVHMLTNHAFNAMLKTLEEPSPHVKFILATTDPQKIPVTVLSRCLQFNLKQMPTGHIVMQLERILVEEKVVFELQALRLLARAAQGSMRDALSLTDQAISYSANEVTEAAVSRMLGALDQTYMVRLLNALVAFDGLEILTIADEMALRSLSFSTALQDLAGVLHRIAWAQFAPESVLDEWPEAVDLRRFADLLSPEQVQLYYQIATVGRGEMGLAPDEYAGFTMTLLRMLAFEPAGLGGGGAVPGMSPVVAGNRRATTVPSGAAEGTRATAPAQPKPPVSEVPTVPVEAAASSEPVPSVAPTTEPRIELAQESTNIPVFPLAAQVDVAPIATQIHAVAEPVAIEPSEPKSEQAAPVESVAPVAAPIASQSVLAAKRPAPTRASGAAGALDVLRSRGIRRVSSASDRERAAAPKQVTPVPKASASAPPVNVLTPHPCPMPTAAASQPACASSPDLLVPPSWDDISPEDYLPVSVDDNYVPPPDNGYIPVFDSGRTHMRVPPQSAPALVDTRPLPPAVRRDAIGYQGECPQLAASLSLKDVAYPSLAFNSELPSLEGGALTLALPVPQYADVEQVVKPNAALAENLGKPVELSVEGDPSRHTATVLDAVERARCQREAAQEIGADPFVQQLIHDFGARIVEGSVKPVDADGANDALTRRCCINRA